MSLPAISRLVWDGTVLTLEPPLGKLVVETLDREKFISPADKPRSLMLRENIAHALAAGCMRSDLMHFAFYRECPLGKLGRQIMRVKG